MRNKTVFLLGENLGGFEERRAAGCKLYKRHIEMKKVNIESVLLEGHPAGELIRYAE